MIERQSEGYNPDGITTKVHSKDVVGGVHIWNENDQGVVSDIKLLYNADVVKSHGDQCTGSTDHIVHIIIGNAIIPILVDSDSQVTVLRADLLPINFITTKEDSMHIQLSGALVDRLTQTL